MKNYVAKGERLAHTNATSTTISSGDVVLITNRIGIAVADIVASAVGQLQVEGVFTLAKTAGQAWTLGQQLYWDASTSKFTSTASSHQKAGFAAAIAASAATSGKIKLNVNG